MKQWITKLLEQFEMRGEDKNSTPEEKEVTDITEDRATLLFIIDIYSRHLIDLDTRPVRKVRAIFDEFAKGLIKPNGPHAEKLLFRFRQFFSGYRIEEFTYLQKTFEDFKGIIWDFADQLTESIEHEQDRDSKVKASIDDLREAVEANSIDELKTKSREFIDYYIELQTKADEKRSARLELVQNSLKQVKEKLVQVDEGSRKDHLTGAFNRKHYDEVLLKAEQNLISNNAPTTLLTLDIDYFKKVNDVFGHDAGDHVLQEFVKVLQNIFDNANHTVARVGGEEFSVILLNTPAASALPLAEHTLEKIRALTVVHNDVQIRFTVSIGAAELMSKESVSNWVKRADDALYKSKNAGRDRITVAPHIQRTQTAQEDQAVSKRNSN